jgi:hypothetical protein
VTSPAHRAAVGFLHGSLVIVVAQVVASPLATVLSSADALAPLVPIARALIPLVGFGLGGAIGGDALAAGTRGTFGCSVGAIAAGLVLTVTSPNLTGLTGHEPLSIVLAYALGTSSMAYALAGAVAGAILGRDLMCRFASAFAAGGVAGGFVGVLPYLLARFVALPSGGLFSQFLWLACSVGGVCLPLCVGGAAAARACHSVVRD